MPAYISSFAITPDDGTILARKPEALLVTASGDLAIIFVKDDPTDVAADVVIIPVTAGQLLPFKVKRVMATGTTATVLGLIE